MYRNFKKNLLACCLLLMMLSVAGCGDKKNESTPTTTVEPTKDATPTATSAPSPTPDLTIKGTAFNANESIYAVEFADEEVKNLSYQRILVFNGKLILLGSVEQKLALYEVNPYDGSIATKKTFGKIGEKTEYQILPAMNEEKGEQVLCFYDQDTKAYTVIDADYNVTQPFQSDLIVGGKTFFSADRKQGYYTKVNLDELKQDVFCVDMENGTEEKITDSLGAFNPFKILAITEDGIMLVNVEEHGFEKVIFYDTVEKKVLKKTEGTIMPQVYGNIIGGEIVIAGNYTYVIADARKNDYRMADIADSEGIIGINGMQDSEGHFVFGKLSYNLEDSAEGELTHYQLEAYPENADGKFYTTDYIHLSELTDEVYALNAPVYYDEETNRIVGLMHNENEHCLYVWDLNKEESKVLDRTLITKYVDPCEFTDEAIAELNEWKEKLETTYGVIVCDDWSEFDDIMQFTMEHCSNWVKIKQTMMLVYECYSSYPEGVISALSPKEEPMRLCFGGKISGNVPFVTGLHNYHRNIGHIVFFDCTSPDMKRVIFHETWHALDGYMTDTGLVPFHLTWENNNPSGFEYVGVENHQNASEEDTMSGPEKDAAYFVDTYAKSNFLEDRARVAEFIFERGLQYFDEYPHLAKKAAVLMDEFRRAFPKANIPEDYLR